MTNIRPMQATDHTAWLALWNAYQQFYEVDIAPVTATTWQRLLDPREPMHGAVAIIDGACVGLVHWLFHRSTWSLADTCYLQDLFVAPDQRGAGLGAALIAHVYDAAGTAGSPEVYWLTHERNSTAMRLYDHVAVRSGFVQYQKNL